MNHMEENGLSTKHQRGFRKVYSCVMQLIYVREKWTEEVDNKNTVDIIYLDFQKAFDTMPHQRLITKLNGYGIQGDIIMWIGDCLKEHKQRVQINRTSSDWADVVSVIPQGSVLGPTLCLVYINDLSDVVCSLVKLFADDAKIFAVVKLDLHNVADWSDKWQIKFNYLKCNHMHLGKDQPVVTYYMNNKWWTHWLSRKIWES